jgi:hypothetical protein
MFPQVLQLDMQGTCKLPKMDKAFTNEVDM